MLALTSLKKVTKVCITVLYISNCIYICTHIFKIYMCVYHTYTHNIYVSQKKMNAQKKVNGHNTSKW